MGHLHPSTPLQSTPLFVLPTQPRFPFPRITLETSFPLTFTKFICLCMSLHLVLTICLVVFTTSAFLFCQSHPTPFYIILPLCVLPSFPLTHPLPVIHNSFLPVRSVPSAQAHTNIPFCCTTCR